MTPYTITLQADHTTFTCQEHETLLQAALRQGLNLPHSCQSGTCKQCQAHIISGTIQHHDAAQHTLSATEIEQGQALLCCCQARSDIVLHIAGYNGAHFPPVKTLPARIKHIQYHNHTAILTLALPKMPPFTFLAGQYIDILLKDGQSRSYSIANSPHHTSSLELHIRQRDNGLFSQMLFGATATLQEKTILRIRGPLGSFVLNNPQNQPLILLATGTGFAPIQSLLHQLIEQAASYPVHLYWGARYPTDFYALNTATTLIAQLPHAQFTPVLSRPDTTWQGATGYITEHVLHDYPDLSAHQVYACGNTAMILDAQRLLCEQGLLAEHFFADAFSPAISASSENKDWLYWLESKTLYKTVL